MKPWSEVEASPEFQALPDFDKSRAQSQYFDEVVVPRLEDPADLEPARNEFFTQFKRSYLPKDSGQNQVSSAVNQAVQSLAKVGTSTVEGLGKFGESYVRNLNPVGLVAQTGVVPGLQSLVDTYASVPAAAAEAADTAQTAVEEAVPVNPLYADTMPVKAAGVGGQAVGQLATVLTGASLTKAPRVLQLLGLGQAGAMGVDSGYDEADRLGVTNPWQRDALALSYAAAEAGVEGMGGFGSPTFMKALTGQIRESMMPAIARGARTAAAEGLEEPITGTAQALASNVFGNEDPARPGYALNGQPLPTIDPTSSEFWKQRGEETLYGTLAGGLFAGAQFAGSRPKVDELKKLQQKAALTIEVMQNKPDLTEEEAQDLETLKREEANLGTMIRTEEAPPSTNIAVEATKMAAQTAAKADLPATAKQLEILQNVLEENEPPQAPLYATEAGFVSPDADAASVEQSIQASEAARTAMDEEAAQRESPVTAPQTDQEAQLTPEEQFAQLTAEREDLAQRRATLQQIPRDRWEEPEVQFNEQLRAREQANTQAVEALRSQRPDLFPTAAAAPTLEERFPTPPPRMPQSRASVAAGAPLRATRKQTMPENPAGAADILDWLVDNKIYVPPKDQQGGEIDFLAQDDRISRYFRQFITTRDSASDTADVIADRAVAEGLLPEGSTANELGAAIEQAIKERKSTRAQIKREGARMKEAERQTTAFYRDTADGPMRIDPADLVKGDVLTVEETPLRVIEVESDEDGYVTSATLQDGKKYGVQTISGDYVFLVDEFRPSPRRPAAEQAEFVPADEIDAQPEEPVPQIKNSREVELNVITKGGLGKETVEASEEVKRDLIEQKKRYTKLLNCLNS